MLYSSFHEKFPAIAEKETRSVTIINNPELPSDTYVLLESYCSDADCDCRRVFLSVLSEKRSKILAVIAFGWEKKAFYAKWLGGGDPQSIKEIQGPALNLASPQSEYASSLLKLVSSVVLKDSKYVTRLKDHYKIYKQNIRKNIQDEESTDNSNIVPFSRNIGRNMACPCGSGKKFKKCCLTKT